MFGKTLMSTIMVMQIARIYYLTLSNFLQLNPEKVIVIFCTSAWVSIRERPLVLFWWSAVLHDLKKLSLFLVCSVRAKCLVNMVGQLDFVFTVLRKVFSAPTWIPPPFLFIAFHIFYDKISPFLTSLHLTFLIKIIKHTYFTCFNNLCTLTNLFNLLKWANKISVKAYFYFYFQIDIQHDIFCEQFQFSTQESDMTWQFGYELINQGTSVIKRNILQQQ